MVERAKHRVRQARETRGLSQIQLAERAQLTRQSVGAIEAGRATPAVDVALRIAHALECQVESLFGTPEATPNLNVELIGEPLTSRLGLGLVGERWVGVPLGSEGQNTAADALVVKGHGLRATVSPLRPLAEACDNLILMGCATGLGVLANRLETRRGAGRCLWLPSSSGSALATLSRGQAHIAGVHLVNTGRADANVEAVRRTARRVPLVLVTLARWQAGLVTRADDLRVRNIADVAVAGVRLVAREKGAGARHLLEKKLTEAGVPLGVVRAAPLVASGHLAVARAIQLGAADVGVATHDAAQCFGLRFVPLAEERYDLVIPEPLLSDARIERLLGTLVSEANRRELAALGYDVTSTGDRVAVVRAA